MTTQEKAQFFALYWGQPVLVCEGQPDYCKVSAYWIDWLRVENERLHNSYLKLKSLSSITDEDAIECTSILFPAVDGFFPVIEIEGRDEIFVCIKAVYNEFSYKGIVQLTRDGKVAPIHGLSSDRLLTCFDFLRSRGYLLPWGNYSVADLIKEGGAKV
jgi:hypothetical protein